MFGDDAHDDSHYVAFTLDQHAEISRLAASLRDSYDVRIATDHVYLPEVAIFTCKGRSPRVRYLLNPLRDGTLILMRPTTGHWHVTSIQVALNKIQYLDQLIYH